MTFNGTFLHVAVMVNLLENSMLQAKFMQKNGIFEINI